MPKVINAQHDKEIEIPIDQPIDVAKKSDAQPTEVAERFVPKPVVEANKLVYQSAEEADTITPNYVPRAIDYILQELSPLEKG